MELKACIYSTFLLHSHSYHPITKPRYFSSFAYIKFIIRTNGHFTDDNNIYDNNFIGIYKYTLNELQKEAGGLGKRRSENGWNESNKWKYSHTHNELCSFVFRAEWVYYYVINSQVSM